MNPLLKTSSYFQIPPLERAESMNESKNNGLWWDYNDSENKANKLTPLLVFAFKFAPLSTKYFTVSTVLHAEARCSAVYWNEINKGYAGREWPRYKTRLV